MRNNKPSEFCSEGFIFLLIFIKINDIIIIENKKRSEIYDQNDQNDYNN